jgi:serine/threonine protein kinase
MRKNEIFQSQRTKLRYTLIRRLGKGGFGEAWEAVPRSGRSLSKSVCLKLNRGSAAWHRECYFGEILQGHSGAIQMSDEFVEIIRKKLVYCAAFDLAAGSLHDLRPAWSAEYSLQQFRQVVDATAALHRMGAVHRDITPMNVLLTFDEKLVLADFGIAAHGVGKPVDADCFNTWYAPDSVFRASANWEPRDDVWQLGQLLAYLLDGKIDDPIKPQHVRKLNCPDTAKAIIYRAIAPRQHRLENAGRMLEIWDSQAVRIRPLRRLVGLNLVFTGPGSRPRMELEKIARRAGATLQRKVSHKTDVLVVGGDAPLWAAGAEGGKKILAALEQQDRGSPIRFISDSEFLAAARRRR